MLDPACGTGNFLYVALELMKRLEGEVLETLVVRAGYLTNDELRDFSAGLGLTITDLQFDYTLLPFESGFGGPAHILTLSYAW